MSGRAWTGLADEDRPGRPKTVDSAPDRGRDADAAAARLGVRHWSSRLLAAELKVTTSSSPRPGSWKQFRVLHVDQDTPDDILPKMEDSREISLMRTRNVDASSCAYLRLKHIGNRGRR
jgi:hypothetical protein